MTRKSEYKPLTVEQRFGECPECGKSWDAGDIPEESREHYSPPYKWSHIIGIVDHNKYDGVLEYMCPFCATRFPAFNEKLQRSLMNDIRT